MGAEFSEPVQTDSWGLHSLLYNVYRVRVPELKQRACGVVHIPPPFMAGYIVNFTFFLPQISREVGIEDLRINEVLRKYTCVCPNSSSSDMLSQAKRFRINREERSQIITDKERARTKLTGRYGQFKGNAGRDELGL